MPKYIMLVDEHGNLHRFEAQHMIRQLMVQQKTFVDAMEEYKETTAVPAAARR